MLENLKVTHYRNGDPIPNVTIGNSWDALTTGAFCEYDNDPVNTDTYGLLYNWYAVNDSRNIAPEGWHVATDAEFQALIDYLGGSSIAGGKMKETGTSHWRSPNYGATNESEFTALPGGQRTFTGSYGWFEDLQNVARFWSSTEQSSANAWTRYLHYQYESAFRYGINKHMGMSVRCIMD